MAVGTVTSNLNDGSLVLSDGTASAVTLTVPVSIGDTTFDALRAVSGVTGQNNEVTYYEARGVLDSVRHTTRIVSSVSFSVHVRDLTCASAGNVLDFVRKTNAYSANLSTLAAGANADVYTVDVILTLDMSDHGGTDSVATLTDCHLVGAFAEGDPNTLTFSGTCYGTVAFTGPS
jgi:hypothetical protein